jgi:spore coat protein A
MISRRNFLKLSAIAGVGLVLPYQWLANAPRVLAFSQSDPLTKFSQKLRKFGSDIPLATKNDPLSNRGWWQPGVDHYTIDIGQFTDKLHPDLPLPGTRLWGFGQGFAEDNPNWTKHLGGVIAAHRGTPVQITFRNHLPDQHIMPIDPTIMGDGGAVNRADVHLHGGLVPWTSDGGPHAWWDPSGSQGVDFLNNQVLRLNDPAAANEAE